MQALDDLVVLDLTQHIAGPYATKLLADYGADVIKVEPPWGDSARRLGPFKDGIDDGGGTGGEAPERRARSGCDGGNRTGSPIHGGTGGEAPERRGLGNRTGSPIERSGLFAFLNANKRSVVLDLRTDEGREQLRRLAVGADLAVESFAPGTLDRLGCGWDFLQAANPSLPLVSISNFGQDGPYRDYKLSELVLYGFAGEMYSMGLTDREPVKMAGTAALFESGSAAAVALLAAVEASRRHGIAQHVDVSLAETQLGGVDRRHATAIAYQFSGRKTVRSAGAGSGMPQGIYHCADGYVDFTAAGLYPDRVMAMIGEEWAQEERYLDPINRLNPEIIDEWNAQFIVWCLERTKREIWAAARRAKVLCGPLFSMEDLFADEHFRGRGFWQTVTHPALGTFEMPGRPFIMAEGGYQLRRPAPLLGEHQADLSAADLPPADLSPDPSPPRRGEPRQTKDSSSTVGASVRESSAASVRPSSPLLVGEGSGERSAGPGGRSAGSGDGRPAMPLAGVRVLDLCVVWAGPFATMLLGDLGAEVIKVENPFVFQPMTRGAIARPPQALLDVAAAWAGGLPGNVPGPRPWNYNPTFVSLYRNKKSFTVDIRRPEGMAVLERLVAKCDVVYENNATGTMEKLGITYNWLREAREDIIFVRVPAYGSSGPYADARALGVHLEGVMGHTLLRGYDDLGPEANTAIYSGDYLAGAQGAFAVIAALHHRERTGNGQLIEIAQAENAAAMFAQGLMDYSLNRRVQGAIGNRDIFGQYPCGVYPCVGNREQGTGNSGQEPELRTQHSGLSTQCEDRWVSIHVQSDEEWAGLKQAMGGPGWADDPRFERNDGRAEHSTEIDERIAAWTATLDDYEVMRRCQAAGVAAAPVLEASRIFDDPQLRARDFFRRQRQADAGEHEYVGPLWRLPETPVEFTQPPVLFGEHNEYVYRELLGYSEAEFEHFRAEGHIAMEYDASVR